jgi:APA family basic amino acid/polyamine antiporter
LRRGTRALPEPSQPRQTSTTKSQLFATKSIDKLISDSERPEHALKKTMGPVSLTALGIGIVVGSGIFTVIGTAIGGNPAALSDWKESPVIDLILHHGHIAGRPGAGPALAISLVMVAFVCAFTGLCYAELASMIPISGSAYTYTYATLGEIIAWIIGWDLILEYAFANMTVSVGFAAHIVDLLDWLHIRIDPKWLSPAYLPQGLQNLAGQTIFPVGWHAGFDIPAFFVVLVLTVVLILGIRESTRTNNIMVLIKIAAILAFVFFGISFIHPSYYHPFAPNGFSGILAGGSIIFFTYIGFDALSTASEECKNPQRDVPIGIIATLIICTILYLGVSLVLTGMVPWRSVADDAAPVVNALKRLSLEPGGHRLHLVRLFVLIGAILGMISSILVGQYGQTRIWFAMSRDRLLPSAFSRLHPRFRTPVFSTIIAGILVSIPAGIFDVGSLAEMTNIGTLFAFILVAIGVIVLRHKQPERLRKFRLIGGPVIPVLSILCCLLLMAGLPAITWVRFFVWLIIGLFVYFFYSRKRSEFYKG